MATACSLPIGNSLLVNYSKQCADSADTSCDSTANSDSGALEISVNSSVASLLVDDGEMFEVTGSCKDLGRKNNRILVQVFAGEDDSSDPYIDNSISDKCINSTNTLRSGLETVLISPKSLAIGTGQAFTFTADGGTAPYTYSVILGAGTVDPNTGLYTSSGVTTGTDVIQVIDATGTVSRSIVTVASGITTPITTVDNKKCLTVTQGVGRVEDAGLVNEKTFPQCHNGKFGFSVRLGKVLVNPTVGLPNLKYFVRYKLRTDEGSIADSPWGTLAIERNLKTPLISSAANVHASQKCTVKTAAARFNHGVFYTLNRTFTDILSTNAGSTNLYTNANTLGVLPGSSVFEWDDIGLTDGVTYNYTLSSTDANFGYSVLPNLSSTVVSCKTKRIHAKISQGSVGGTCYLALQDAGTAEQITTFNPYVTYEWGYNTTAGWIGTEGKANSGYATASCGNSAVCTQSGLSAGTTYFFALRAKNLVRGEIGIWSPVVACQVN